MGLNKLEKQTLDAVSNELGVLIVMYDAGATRLELRAQIEKLEAKIALMPQVDHGLTHSFSEGLYIRLAEILPGTLFTTPIYRQECILTMLKGHIVVFTEHGMTKAEAGDFVVTEKGTKRVILALDDVLAHTVHPNPDNERNVEVLEDRIYAKTFADIELEGSLS